MRAGRGQVGALLLAGGQGTRLGSDAPKGCYDIGLPSHKPLFQYHAEKVLGVRSLAASALGIHISEVRLPLLVMTSDATDGPTRRFWAERDHFGLPEDQVFAEICAGDALRGTTMRPDPVLAQTLMTPDGTLMTP